MRVLTSRFQQRAMSLCEVPAGTTCPNCHHDFDIVVSRKQLESGFMTKRLLRHYHCRVCGHCFSRLNRYLLFRQATAAFVLLICMTLGLSRVDADIVEYCDVNSLSIDFVDLVETSTGEGEMYGQAVDAGDAIEMPGIGFLTAAAGGSISLVDGRLQMTIESNDGSLFDELLVEQFGSYFNVGAGSLSVANAFGWVDSGGTMYSGSLLESFVGGGAGGWSDDFTISFPATDSITFALSTQLLASAGIGEAAYIDASLIRISLNTIPIPEPGLTHCLALAVMGMVALRRRRSRNGRTNIDHKSL
ncbi:MAG: hypothetical protein ACR2NP_08870 [Pirellulaceae bacterium]